LREDREGIDASVTGFTSQSNSREFAKSTAQGGVEAHNPQAGIQ
jgi:hypothetical protein